MKIKRDFKKEKEKRKRLYKKYGHLIGCSTEDIPAKHRATRGGLRCFKRIYPRDEHGNKIRGEERVRCGKVCSKGSLYCKTHGGANSKALVKGGRSELDPYRGAYTKDLGKILEVFINDPDILSHKRELGTLRLLLTEYIKRYSSNKPLKNPRKLISLMQEVLEQDHLSHAEKFNLVKEIVDQETSLTDGNVVDRISRLVENIGKSIERIDRVERKADFFLTPEGFKIVLRTVIELVNVHVKDTQIQEAIRKGLLEAGTKTTNGVENAITVNNENER